MTPLPETLDLDQVRVDPAWALRIPASLALRRQILPFAGLDGRVYVACADPGDRAALDAVRRHTGLEPVPLRAARDPLQPILARVYGDGSGAHPVLRAESATPLTADDAVVLADAILRAAVLRQASDVHLDPERDHLRVRLRVDGVLEELHRLPAGIHPALCSRVKVLAGMDIAERRAPQDGAFAFRCGPVGSTQAIDVRVATLPTKHGERLTLRLLAAQDRRLSLEALGLRGDDLAAVERVLAQPHGLLLLTGPTGAGKSTTLYAAIERLKRSVALNILTVEDPVEYEIAGVGQAEVDAADKISFAKALRSLLRHDPDVIMIGEIRDAESLDIALKASLTGHLVLSTLHANDAPGVVTRLLDMGAHPPLVAATLRLSVSQRLVRRLCRHCRRPVPLAPAAAAALGKRLSAGTTVHEPAGCLYCAGRGYAGRMGLFECAAFDAESAARVAAGCPQAELVAVLKRKGFRSLLDDAAAKIRDGLTTVADALEAVQEW